MSQHQFTWPEAATSELVRLWNTTDASATQIACSLAGVLGRRTTRNQVLGKVYRLRGQGIHMKPRSSASTGLRTPKPKRKREKHATVLRSKKVSAIPMPRRRRIRSTHPLADVANEIRVKIDEDPQFADHETEFLRRSNIAQPQAKRIGLDDLNGDVCRWPLEPDLRGRTTFCGCATKSGDVYCERHRALGEEMEKPRRHAPAS